MTTKAKNATLVAMENKENTLDSQAKTLGLTFDLASIEVTKKYINTLLAADKQLQQLKAEVDKRESEVATSDELSLQLQAAAADHNIKELVVAHGGKYNEDMKTFDKKGERIYKNLCSLAKVDGEFYNYTLKQSVVLKSDKVLKSWAVALSKEYNRRQAAAGEKRKRTTADDKIIKSFEGLANTPFDFATKCKMVAGAEKTTPEHVAELCK